MGSGRFRALTAAAVIGTALLVGCGESRHPNQQRPQVSTRVSVTISPKQLIAQPTAVAVGPEPKQEIEQNQGHPAPPIKTKAPLNLTIVAANQTPTDTKLKITGTK